MGDLKHGDVDVNVVSCDVGSRCSPSYGVESGSDSGVEGEHVPYVLSLDDSVVASMMSGE